MNSSFDFLHLGAKVNLFLPETQPRTRPHDIIIKEGMCAWVGVCVYEKKDLHILT